MKNKKYKILALANFLFESHIREFLKDLALKLRSLKRIGKGNSSIFVA
ncbi:hypothetical protein VIBNISFn118_1160076 [Vibrio nigripulchritudo SFn118]|nr:hypothetical protein VIBNISFn118_1160076 [Vibrio nigripulchritudo SFn118]